VGRIRSGVQASVSFQKIPPASVYGAKKEEGVTTQEGFVQGV